MPGTFRNFLHVFKRFKLAASANLLGLSFAFLSFMLICIHVRHEYGFDSAIANKERIFQLENLRDDGVWESNFSRPQLERLIAATPQIEAAAITNNLVYSSFRFGVSISSGPDASSYIGQLERITPDYTKVFDFDMVTGDTDCLKSPNNILLSEKMAEKLFGRENPLGKPVYFSEFNGVDNFVVHGMNFASSYTVGGGIVTFRKICG